jgi:hypothetical protein
MKAGLDNIQPPGAVPGAMSPARQALEDYDNFVTSTRDPQSMNLDGLPMNQISRLAAREPDALANAIINGKSASAQRAVQNLRTSMGATDPTAPPGQVSQAWRDFAATVFRRMGTPTGAATGAAEAADFSPMQFATRWNNMDPGTREALFRGYLPEKTWGDMNDFAQLSKAMQQSAQAYNWTQSGNVVNTMNAWYRLGTGAMQALGGHPAPLLGALATFKLAPDMVANMQNPNYIRWLAGMGRDAMSGTPGWAARAVGRLPAVGLDDKAKAWHERALKSLEDNQQP